MERCHGCNRSFGLVRHRWWGYQFCQKNCLKGFLAMRSQQITRMREWLDLPHTSEYLEVSWTIRVDLHSPSIEMQHSLGHDI
jgi:hypothetical protein